MGKRDVKCSGQLTDEEAAAVAKEVEDTCLSLDFDSEVGLTKDTVDATFAQSDGQNNSVIHSVNQHTNQPTTRSLANPLAQSVDLLAFTSLSNHHPPVNQPINLAIDPAKASIN